jgi:hypothetical protein
VSVVWKPSFKIRVNFLLSAISNNKCSRSKVQEVSFLINHLITIGLCINLNRELRFLNLRTDHSVLHQLNRKRFALRVENLHLLRALCNVIKSMIPNKIKKMTHVTQRHY